MKSKILGLLAVAMLAGPTVANAALVSTSIGDYELSLIEGSWVSLEDTLRDQAWFGSQTLAIEFATAAGAGFGAGSNGNGVFSAFFAFAPPGTTFTASYWLAFSPNAVVLSGGSVDVSYTWAIAERVAVPEPGSLALLGLGVLGAGVARRRKAS